MTKILTLFYVLLITKLIALTPIINNVQFDQQINGSGIVSIYYDLFDPENDICTISLFLSTDSGESFTIISPSDELSGDVGNGIRPGENKIITWDTRATNRLIEEANVCFKIVAEDWTQAFLPQNFVIMPGRTYTMGRTTGVGDEDDYPPHLVTLSPYAISKYEVTQGEWIQVMGSNPAYGYGVGQNYPVYNVSWYQILKFCNLKSISAGYEPVYSINGSTDPTDWGPLPTNSNTTWDLAVCNLDASGFRLPTEAEWEFAARGGTNSPDYAYSGSNVIGNVAWYSGNNTVYGVKPVGLKQPNHLGIYDMSGNLWEYCWDWFAPYPSNHQHDPLGGVTGTYRIARGGYWLNLPPQCETHQRSGFYTYSGSYWMGFRLCLSITER